MRYPGGKGRCFQHIISLMPPHETYIETHLGGGAVMRQKRPARKNIGIDIDPSVISMWADMPMQNLELRSLDAVEFLRSYQFNGRELVYADPPYLASTRSRSKIYRYEYDDSRHVELLTALRQLPCFVIVSGYAAELYTEMLEGWREVSFPGDSHTGPRTEFAWLNFDPPEALHDYRFCGSDFRERERIKRRRVGLTKRIASLSAVERRALFQDLTGRFAHEFGLEGER